MQHLVVGDPQPPPGVARDLDDEDDIVCAQCDSWLGLRLGVGLDK